MVVYNLTCKRKITLKILDILLETNIIDIMLKN